MPSAAGMRAVRRNLGRSAMLRHIQRRLIVSRIAAGVMFALVTAAPAGAVGRAADPTELATNLVNDVTVNGVNRHLIALQRLAERDAGTRAAGTPGHLASADYIAGRLTAAGYAVQVQEFRFPFEQTLAQRASEVAPTPRTLRPVVMQFSPNTPLGGITAPLSVLPDPADATPGCEPADFASGTFTGTVVLVKRGGGTFQQKHDNAVVAGAG